jgi:5-methylcytosine-specific restriction enzyme subunit McrC
VGKKSSITVFEHQTKSLRYFQDELGDQEGTKLFEALQHFYGQDGVPYYTLGHKCVRFCEYVGVLQIGNTTIEILPKTDNGCDNDEVNRKERYWQNMLINMLRTVGGFDIDAPSSGALQLKANSILDLYFELFIRVVEQLLHAGLAKKYRKEHDNCNALKGSLLFSRQISKNLVHKEKFFTRHTVYDTQHTLHQILYKAVLLLQQINTNTALKSRIGSLLLHFPEQEDIRVFESTFEKLTFNRKTATYRKAIEIARLLLLNYHPNISQGRNHVLALMFDMNMLWEKFVYICLRKHLVRHDPQFQVTAQTTRHFWKPLTGYTSYIKPDIVIHYGDERVVLDTKWKNIETNNPSPEDLRQLYVYHQLYDARKVALVYPGITRITEGVYFNASQQQTNRTCAVICIDVKDHSKNAEEDPQKLARINISQWRTAIGDQVLQWLINTRHS